MVIFKKLKKVNKFLLLFFILTLISYLLSYIFFSKSLISLVGIETLIRVIVLVFFFFIYLLYTLGGLISLILRRAKTFLGITLIMCLFIPLFYIGSYYIDITLNKLDNTSKEKVVYTTNLITLKDKNITNEKKTKIGMISNENDVEGNILAKQLIKNEKLDKPEIVYYEEYIDLINALYTKEVDGIFVSSNYSIMFSSETSFETIKEDTRVKYEYSRKMKNADTVQSTNKKLTEPFSLLLIGVDSEKESMNASSSFNGDTLMLLTFNPKTMNLTMFSIPRDTYVPISCKNNNYGKINSSSYGGTNCVIKTIENLTGVTIDYYVKINFKGVVNLVDALEKIEVNVPINFCEQDSNRRFGNSEICLKKGIQNLNGEQALALARHRHSLPLGDFQRVQHQQLIVEAISKKATSIHSISDFYKVLDAIVNNIETNMATSQMLSFYEVAKDMLGKVISNSGEEFFTIERTYLTGNDARDAGNNYIFKYNANSLKEIINEMKINLELQDRELIKKFEFSANEEYETKVYGKVY